MMNIVPVTFLFCGMEICTMLLNISRKEQKHFQPSRLYSSIIMTYSTFGLDYILDYCKYLVPIFSALIGYWQIKLVLCEGAAAKRKTQQWTKWTRLSILSLHGYDLAHYCDKSTAFSFFHASCFTCSVSHLDHLRGSGGGGRLCSWIQRARCFANWAQLEEIELCNSDIMCNWRFDVQIYVQHQEVVWKSLT